MLWVDSTTVHPPSVSVRSVRMSAAAVTGSRPAVGSSSTSKRGRARSSTAMLARLR
jgi:hypothetical protein